MQLEKGGNHQKPGGKFVTLKTNKDQNTKIPNTKRKGRQTAGGGKKIPQTIKIRIIDLNKLASFKLR